MRLLDFFYRCDIHLAIVVANPVTARISAHDRVVARFHACTMVIHTSLEIVDRVQPTLDLAVCTELAEIEVAEWERNVRLQLFFAAVEQPARTIHVNHKRICQFYDHQSLLRVALAAAPLALVHIAPAKQLDPREIP